MDQYKKEITNLFEKMTKDDQVELHGRIARGDLNARDKVVQNCLPLAYRIADSYHVNNKNIDFEPQTSSHTLQKIKPILFLVCENGICVILL